MIKDGEGRYFDIYYKKRTKNKTGDLRTKDTLYVGTYNTRYALLPV